MGLAQRGTATTLQLQLCSCAGTTVLQAELTEDI